MFFWLIVSVTSQTVVSSLNVLFYQTNNPEPKDVWFTITAHQENQNILILWSWNQLSFPIFT